MVPGVGAVISGSLDLVETKVIANRAYTWFFENNFSVDGQNDESDIIEIYDFVES